MRTPSPRSVSSAMRVRRSRAGRRDIGAADVSNARAADMAAPTFRGSGTDGRGLTRRVGAATRGYRNARSHCLRRWFHSVDTWCKTAVMDTYTHGHAEPVLQSHRWRTAANSAGYLLPSLRPALDLLDVGC